MYEEPTNEEIEEVLNKTARLIAKYDMEAPAILFLQTFRPLGDLFGQLGLLIIAPFLPFDEKELYRMIEVIGKTGNMEKLRDMIEELAKNKEKKEKDSGMILNKLFHKLKKCIPYKDSNLNK
jgi:hypothetical protein